MRATLIGHATWLLETEAGAVLTDPVLSDPFEDDTVVSCPRREVHLEHLPPLAAIFLSHRHLDHFHLPSLERLDRRVPVFCPDDALLLRGLRAVGFTDCRLLHAFEPVQLGPLRLLPTPSSSPTFVEYGLVFEDHSGRLFNQVDTPLSRATIERLHALSGRPDVHLAAYATQDFGLFEARRQDTAGIYARNLDVAEAVGARCVVPAAAGFRFADDVGWLNAHLFPIAEARFAADLRKRPTRPQVECLLPGDTLELTAARVTVHRQQAPYVSLVANDAALLTYAPDSPVPELTDLNEPEHPADYLAQFIDGFMETGLSAFLADAVPANEAVVSRYVAANASYQVEVVFPDHTRRWAWQFDAAAHAVRRADDLARPDITKSIAASTLVDLVSGHRSCFYARTRSRRSSEGLDLRDLLSHFVLLWKLTHRGERGRLEYYGLLSTAERAA